MSVTIVKHTHMEVGNGDVELQELKLGLKGKVSYLITPKVTIFQQINYFKYKCLQKVLKM